MEKMYACKCGNTLRSLTPPAACSVCGKTMKAQSSVPSKSYIRVFELYESTKCRECGRVLKSEESIKRGFGPSCGTHVAERYFNRFPRDLGERAKKIWTKEEISKLVDFAHKSAHKKNKENKS